MSIQADITLGFEHFEQLGQWQKWYPDVRGHAGVLLMQHMDSGMFYICYGRNVHQLAIARMSQIRKLGTNNALLNAAYAGSPHIQAWVQTAADFNAALAIAGDLYRRYIQTGLLFNSSGGDSGDARSAWGMKLPHVINVHGREFKSQVAAAKALGLTQYELQKRVRSLDPQWVDYVLVNDVAATAAKAFVRDHYVRPKTTLEEAESALFDYMFAKYPERKYGIRDVPDPQAAA